MSDTPSAIELVDGNTLQAVHELNPNQLAELIKPPFPAITMLVEFDDNDRTAKKAAKKAVKILDKYSKGVEVSTDADRQQQLWKIRQSVSSLIGHNNGLLRSLPLFDGAVASDRLREYIEGIYQIMKANNLKPALWGHAGDGIIHLQPQLNLGQVGDRQKAFRLLNDYHQLVIKLGGTLSSEAGDGRLRTPYLETMYGPELYALLQKVKQIFDPYGTLNAGVKFDTSVDDLKAMIRNDYGIDHLYDHLPRS